MLAGGRFFLKTTKTVDCIVRQGISKGGLQEICERAAEQGQKAADKRTSSNFAVKNFVQGILKKCRHQAAHHLKPGLRILCTAAHNLGLPLRSKTRRRRSTLTGGSYPHHGPGERHPQTPRLRFALRRYARVQRHRNCVGLFPHWACRLHSVTRSWPLSRRLQPSQGLEAFAEETRRVRELVEATSAEARSVCGDVESRIATLASASEVSAVRVAAEVDAKVAKVAEYSDAHVSHVAADVTAQLEKDIQVVASSTAATAEIVTRTTVEGARRGIQGTTGCIPCGCPPQK